MPEKDYKTLTFAGWDFNCEGTIYFATKEKK
jgi:hypothetical protein